jgi:hypothetical protein
VHRILQQSITIVRYLVFGTCSALPSGETSFTCQQASGSTPPSSFSELTKQVCRTEHQLYHCLIPTKTTSPQKQTAGNCQYFIFSPRIRRSPTLFSAHNIIRFLIQPRDIFESPHETHKAKSANWQEVRGGVFPPREAC